MPKKSKAEKRNSHEKIIYVAAELFLDQGIAETSVSEIMQKARITHGGFYRHIPARTNM
ncbi:TetR/AcrR family transcriptional regulator [Ruegeria atlantica]|uniref:TetR/AcrR family transcriptional regulator n=1 Tax=Ruegeria atlantica TaxID=81569 RepID=UPI00147DD6F3|nr:TetR family transcriptional regulator [Ruegeria atlantica]